MGAISLEDHFLSAAFHEAMSSLAVQTDQRGANDSTNDMYVAARESKLLDLGEQRLADMDAGGIDVQVISHTAEMARLPTDQLVRLTRAANDQLAQAVAAHPTRFAGFAMLPMSAPEATAEELERAVRTLGFKGAMIDGTTNGRFLDDAAFLPVLERAVALDVPLYIHPDVPPDVVREAYYSGFEPAVNFALATSAWGWHAETAVHALRLILAGVFDRYPSLQIIIGHMGEMLPFMLARIQNTLTPVAGYLHRSVPDYFKTNFHITTSGFFTVPPFALALELLGPERILFSVDYPYSSNEQGRAFLVHV